MTARNVEIVESLYAAFARGDLQAVLDAMDPDIAWQTQSTLPWSDGDYRGPAGASAYFASIMTAINDPEIVPEEFLDAGDHVVVHGEERGIVTATGRRFVAGFTHTWTLRDGLVTRMRGMVDTAAVLDSFAPAAGPV